MDDLKLIFKALSKIKFRPFLMQRVFAVCILTHKIDILPFLNVSKLYGNTMMSNGMAICTDHERNRMFSSMFIFKGTDWRQFSCNILRFFKAKFYKF